MTILCHCTPIILILRIVEVFTPCFYLCSRLMNTFNIHVIMLISMTSFMYDGIDNLLMYIWVRRTYIHGVKHYLMFWGTLITKSSFRQVFQLYF